MDRIGHRIGRRHLLATGRNQRHAVGKCVDAAVTAKDADRGTQWQSKTNQEGIYNLPQLPIGR